MPDPGHPELADGEAAVREIVACAGRTLAAPSARIALHWERPQRPGGLPGVMVRVADGAVKLVATAWWRNRSRRLEATGGLESERLAGEGIADPAQDRYMIDYGSWAVLHADGKTFRGPPGRALQALPTSPARTRVEEMWWPSLLRWLPSITDAALEGTDTVHGTLCQRLAAHIDTARVASREGLRPLPLIDRWEALRVLPVTVWIDGQHVRRIGFGLAPAYTTTIDLWEFGVPTGDLDWSRLPAFRSPGHEQERR